MDDGGGPYLVMEPCSDILLVLLDTSPCLGGHAGDPFYQHQQVVTGQTEWVVGPGIEAK